MSKRILLVDDDAGARLALRAIMEGAHFDGQPYELAEAKDGQQALEMLDTFVPDLVLLDYRMPGMDGIQFLAALQDRAHQPISLVITGFDDEAKVFPGAAWVLRKPVESDELLSKVDWHLRHAAVKAATAATVREAMGRNETIQILALCAMIGLLVIGTVEWLTMTRVASMPARVVVVEVRREAPSAPPSPGTAVNRYLASQVEAQNAETERLLRRRHARLH